MSQEYIDDGAAATQSGISAWTNIAPQSSISELDIEAMAFVCHETIRAYCSVIGERPQPPWHLAPEWQRESTAEGIRFAIANPDAPNSAQHEAWMAEKIKDGWTYGPERDEERKTHPCLVPWNQLPILQRLKDPLFRAVVKALTSNP